MKNEIVKSPHPALSQRERGKSSKRKLNINGVRGFEIKNHSCAIHISADSVHYTRINCQGGMKCCNFLHKIK